MYNVESEWKTKREIDNFYIYIYYIQIHNHIHIHMNVNLRPDFLTKRKTKGYYDRGKERFLLYWHLLIGVYTERVTSTLGDTAHRDNYRRPYTKRKVRLSVRRMQTNQHSKKENRRTLVECKNTPPTQRQRTLKPITETNFRLKVSIHGTSDTWKTVIEKLYVSILNR